MSSLEQARELHLRAVAENGAGRPGPGSKLVVKGLRLLGVDADKSRRRQIWTRAGPS